MILAEPDADASASILEPVVEAAPVDVGDHVPVVGLLGVVVGRVTLGLLDEQVGNRVGDRVTAAMVRHRQKLVSLVSSRRENLRG